MIDVHCTSPLERLHSLGANTLVIRANPKGGWTGYLDFSEVQILSLENTCGQIEKLNSSSPKSNGLRCEESSYKYFPFRISPKLGLPDKNERQQSVEVKYSMYTFGVIINLFFFP